MAYLNDIYVFVETEDVSNEATTVNHPTESGMPTSDTIRKNPIIVNIKGKIVYAKGIPANYTIIKLKKMQKEGTPIKYVGRAGTISSLQIQSFNESYTNKNNNGADFDMTLKELKTAKSAYVKTTQKKSTFSIYPKPTDYIGKTVYFTGGSVYISSDAKKLSATRGKSRCKLTKMKANAAHPYHLISQDCSWGSKNYVYGWVDANNVQFPNINLNNSSNSGTQQVNGTNRAVTVHTVKKGDTIYMLCTSKYKNLNLKATQVISDNPHAFSRKGDATTLIIGAKLYLYHNR